MKTTNSYAQTEIDIEMSYQAPIESYWTNEKTIHLGVYTFSIINIIVDIGVLVAIITWYDTFCKFWWMYLGWNIISICILAKTDLPDLNILGALVVAKIVCIFVIGIVAFSTNDINSTKNKCNQIATKYNITTNCNDFGVYCTNLFTSLAENFANKHFTCSN